MNSKPTESRTISLALQGGGSHGAFTWGVLDKLLEDGRLALDGISGASAGAMNAVAVGQGYAAVHGSKRDPREAAREALAMFWGEVGKLGAASAVLHILLRVVEAHLRKSCPGASAQARFGAVSFVHRFGASLNRHIHYPCCILDGVFDPIEEGAVQFRQASALAPEEVAVIEEQVRRRVLRWFSRHGLLDPDDARDRLAWANGGFSLDFESESRGFNFSSKSRLCRTAKAL